MDKQLNYSLLSYNTIYQCVGDGIDITEKNSACFSTLFNKIEGTKVYDLKYIITVYKKDNQAKRGYSNHCFLTKEELRYFINSIKKICKFSFHIQEDEEKFYIILKIKQQKLIHKFILTWIRYCYEFPGNFCVKYAFKLKNNFKKLSFFNLVNLINFSLYYKMADIHNFSNTLTNQYAFGYTLIENKKALDFAANSYKSYLFNCVKNITVIENLHKIKLRNIDDWEISYNNNILLETMKKNYIILKNGKC